MKSGQIWAVLILLASTAGLVHLRGDTDRVPPSVPLNNFPSSIDSWTSQDIPLNQETLDVLGKGVFLNRIYIQAKDSTDPSGRGGASASASPPVSLFIGYFPTQRSGQSIHSPQNCLPGSGWTFESSGVTTIPSADGKKDEVGEYLITDGTSRQEVLYWYRTHGRSIANDYSAKAHMLLDAILYDRTDAALVRVITPLQRGETQQDAHLRAMRFTEKMTPLLPAYIPD